jgi:hypothetical protein
MRSEDDIRAAFGVLAGQAPDADAVLNAVRERLETPRVGQRQASRGRRLLAGLASAVAVMAIIGGSIALALGGHAPHRAAASPPAQVPDAQPGPPGTAPPYYLILPNNGMGPDVAVVDTATGATLATVRPPKPFRSFGYIIGAADDRTFVLAAQRTALGGAATLFRARFDPSRRAVTLTALPIPPTQANPQDMALSPDGSRLAVLTAQARSAQLSVYSMTTGAVKVWRQVWRQPSGGVAYEVSWGRGGILAYNWDSGVWLLNTATAGGGLIANSRLAVSAPHGWTFGLGALLTPDGRTVVAAQERWLHQERLLRRGTNSEFAEYSAKTGKQIEALWPEHYAIEDLGWTSPSGNVLIVEVTYLAKNRYVLGTLSGGRLTPILSQAVPSSGGWIRFAAGAIAF